MSNLTIEDRIKEIRKRMDSACQSVGRNPEEVRLLLAVKTVPAEKIIQALDFGETLLGENKVQELQQKYTGLK
ncbi:hypothetical protein [Paenibacillus sp. BJ-4]|uniref:hypothetical protein n=1 Tax=Paenibacillus sp. BJ-4 TaxID=2878097 RepID=UPI001CF03182|nr:hypothetical protein [Paenibacillus sp. BJ-4]